MKLREWKLKHGFFFLAVVLRFCDLCWHIDATDSFIVSGPHTRTPISDSPVSLGNLENISV